jgi:hypothetical protein
VPLVDLKFLTSLRQVMQELQIGGTGSLRRRFARHPVRRACYILFGIRKADANRGDFR